MTSTYTLTFKWISWDLQHTDILKYFTAEHFVNMTYFREISYFFYRKMVWTKYLNLTEMIKQRLLEDVKGRS